MKKVVHIPKKVKEAILVMTGVVLVWRGMWVILDTVDIALFGGQHYITGIISTIAGFVILYYLDDEMDSLARL